MVASSSSVCLVLLCLFCTSCQHHASAVLSANSTSGHSFAAVGGRSDNVTNTTVRLDHARPPLPWSKARTSWPTMEDVRWSRLPNDKGGIGAGDHFTIHDAGRSRSPYRYVDAAGGSAAAAPASSNSSAATESAPRPRTKNGHAGKGRNQPLCSYHRAASLVHGRVDCSGVVVVVVAVSVLLILLCSASATALLLLRCMHNRKVRGETAGGAAGDPEDHDKDGRPALPQGPRPYSYRELAAAAGNFAESRRLGRGGCGSVYRGYLADQERHVAVKVFSLLGSPEQGRREFDAEVRVLSQLRHRNVVRFVGWCIDDDDCRKGLLLAYELAPGGSLDKSLHDPDEMLLTWSERYRIVLGLGACVLYLHTECEQCIVHGDIKPANILLDASRNCKLGDFGLARVLGHGADPETTQVVAGTVGYIDPEFVNTQTRSIESDVYSFGVVLLEIATGERPAKRGAAAAVQSRVRGLYDRDDVLHAADRRLQGAFEEREMERVLVTGLWCAHRDRTRRPSIAEAMAVLRSERSDLPVLPPVVAHAQHGALLGQGFAVEQPGDDGGNLSSEDDKSTPSSASTAYLSPQDSTDDLCAQD